MLELYVKNIAPNDNYCSISLVTKQTEVVIVSNNFDDAEDNLTFSDTLIALQLMHTQFPKLEKVFGCIPCKYNFFFPILSELGEHNFIKTCFSLLHLVHMSNWNCWLKTFNFLDT